MFFFYTAFSFSTSNAALASVSYKLSPHNFSQNVKFPEMNTYVTLN